MPPTLPARGRPFACSWSGGKDGALALHRARCAGARPVRLLTMMSECGERSRSHGLSLPVLREQAACLGVELRTAGTTWAGYEATLIDLLAGCAADGIADAVFGDIDHHAHRLFEERVCAAAGVTAHLPLWRVDRERLLEEAWAVGMRAMIVVVRDGVVDRGYLGRELDRQAARELAARGVDPCGENGEFHTIAVDGPVFERPLSLELGAQVRRADCWVQDLSVHGPGGRAAAPAALSTTSKGA